MCGGGGIGGFLGDVLGGGAGFLVGGPVGAAIGTELGGTLGGVASGEPFGKAATGSLLPAALAGGGTFLGEALLSGETPSLTTGPLTSSIFGGGTGAATDAASVAPVLTDTAAFTASPASAIGITGPASDVAGVPLTAPASSIGSVAGSGAAGGVGAGGASVGSIGSNAGSVAPQTAGFLPTTSQALGAAGPGAGASGDFSSAALTTPTAGGDFSSGAPSGDVGVTGTGGGSDAPGLFSSGVGKFISGNLPLLATGAGLLMALSEGNKIPELSNLQGSAAQGTAFGQQLQGQGQQEANALTTGLLPPGAQSAIDQGVSAARANIASNYANLGLSGSTMENQALQGVDMAAAAQKFADLSQVAQQGLALIGAGQSSINEANAVYSDLMNTQLQQDLLTQVAISNLAAALAGSPTIKALG